MNLMWLKRIKKHRAIAVIRASNINLGYAMAQAVADGGMKLIEITWNSDRPTELIHQLREKLPDCTIGAGTLLQSADVREAITAGAEFLFTPHFNPNLIQLAQHHDIPMIPGALTPTEIVTAWQAGAACVKVFPIQVVGGAEYIRCLRAPLGEIPLIPTGGVTLENAKEFIAAGAIGVGLSGQLFPKEAIATRDWSFISQQASQLMENLRP